MKTAKLEIARRYVNFAGEAVEQYPKMRCRAVQECGRGADQGGYNCRSRSANSCTRGEILGSDERRLGYARGGTPPGHDRPLRCRTAPKSPSMGSERYERRFLPALDARSGGPRSAGTSWPDQALRAQPADGSGCEPRRLDAIDVL